MHFRRLIPSLRDDESIFVFTRPYFLAFLPWLAIGLTLIVIGVVFIVAIQNLFPELLINNFSFNIFVIMSSAYFLFLIPFMTVAFIDFYYDIHVVTNRRLIDIDQNNLFSREINELALEEVQDVTSRNKGILSSVFDFGDVIIETAGSQQKFEFNSVLHPREIASIILDLSEQAKQQMGSGELEVLMPRTSPKGVINGKIMETLAPLKAMGAVVSDSFEVPTENAPAKPGVKPPAKATSEDDDTLDIVIDDPNQPKK